MFRIRQLLAGLALAVLAVLAAGCSSAKEETIEVKNTDPMRQVKATLENYVRGQPLASEVTSFDYMVAEVRKVDPAKADILKDGLDDLKKTKGRRAVQAKAAALLKRLGLDGPKGTK